MDSVIESLLLSSTTDLDLIITVCGGDNGSEISGRAVAFNDVMKCNHSGDCVSAIDTSEVEDDVS